MIGSPSALGHWRGVSGPRARAADCALARRPRLHTPVGRRAAEDEAAQVEELRAVKRGPQAAADAGSAGNLQAVEREPQAVADAGAGLSAVWKLLNQNYAGWVLLNLVTVLWGSQHAVIKIALEDAGGHTSPAELNLARFVIAAAVFVGAAFARLGSAVQAADAAGAAQGEERVPGGDAGGEDSTERADGGDAESGPGAGVLKAGAELGVYTFAGYAMQSIGLQYTTASRSAFLLYLNVKLVPILGLLLYGRSINGKTWLNVGVALAGTVLLGYDGNSAPNIGDAWSVAAAAASALFILRLEGAAQRHDPAQLNAVLMLTVSALCLVWLGASHAPPALSPFPSPPAQPLQPLAPPFPAADFLTPLPPSDCRSARNLVDRGPPTGGHGAEGISLPRSDHDRPDKLPPVCGAAKHKGRECCHHICHGPGASPRSQTPSLPASSLLPPFPPPSCPSCPCNTAPSLSSRPRPHPRRSTLLASASCYSTSVSVRRGWRAALCSWLLPS